MMTLDEFCATGRDVADLDAAGSDTGLDSPAPGRVYHGGCYLNRDDAGQLYLHIETSEYHDESQAQLEARLYQWAASAGYFD